MADFRFVTDQDIGSAAEEFHKIGIPTEEIFDILDEYLPALEKHKAYEAAKESGPPLITKAALTEAPQLVGNLAAGLQAHVPTGGIIDQGLEKIKKYQDVPLATVAGIGELITGAPLKDALASGTTDVQAWRQQAQEAAGGTPLDPDTIQAQLGLSAPYLAEFLGLSAIGKVAGAYVGGVIGAAVTPEAAGAGGIPGSAVGSKVGGIALPYAGAYLGAAGQFSREAQDAYGIDREVAEDMSRRVGIINGALQNLESVGGVGPFKTARDVLIKKALGTGVVRTALRELGMSGLIGVETGFQTAVTNAAMEKSIQKMKEKNPGWEPKQPFEPANIDQAVETGAVTGFITRQAFRVGGKLAGAPERIRLEKDLEKLSNLEQLGKLTTEMLKPTDVSTDAAAPLAKELNRKIAETPYTVEEKRERIGNMDKGDLLKASNRIFSELKLEGKKFSIVTPKQDLINFLQSNLPALEHEGPIWGRQKLSGAAYRKVLITDAPVFDKVGPEDQNYGRVWESASRDMVKSFHKDEIPIPPAEMNGFLRVMKRNSLEHAGFGRDMANELLGTVEVRKPDRFYEILTRTQYNKYINHLEGQTRDITNAKLGKLALETLNASIWKQIKMAPMRGPDGKDITSTIPEAPPGASIEMVGQFRPMQAILRQLSNSLNLSFHSFDNALNIRRKEKNEMYINKSKARRAMWYDVDKDITRGGRQQEAFNKLVTWIEGGAETGGKLADETPMWKVLKDQFGLKKVRNNGVGGSDELAANVLSEGRIQGLTVEQVKKQAQTVAGHMRNYYDWFVRNGLLSMKHYNEHYFPMMTEYLKSVETNNKLTFEDYITQKSNMDKLTKAGMTEDQINRMIDFGDMLRGMDRKGLTTGEKAATFEFIRQADREFMKTVAIVTDPEHRADMYTRRALNILYFRDMAPMVHGMMSKITSELSAKGYKSKGVEEVMKSYLLSMFGMPETSSTLVRNLNIRSHSNAVGKMLDNFLNLADERWGHLYNFRTKKTVGDLTHDLLNTSYAMTLGVPFNWKAPIMNIATQLPLANIFGMRSFVHGLGRYLDRSPSNAKFHDTLNGFKFIEDVPMQEERTSSTSSMMDKLTSYSMKPFAATDLTTRNVAGAIALTNWEQLESHISKVGHGQITMEMVGDALFHGKDPSKLLGPGELGLLKKDVYLAKMLKETAPGAFKGVSRELWGKINKGSIKEARDMYVHFSVESSNWRYGAGGSPAIFRFPLVRLLAMYKTYALNYIEFNAMLLHPKNGMLKQAFQVHASLALMATAMAALGLKTSQWFGTGPLPEDWGFSGPIASMVNGLFRVAKAKGDEFGAELIPTISDEERKRIHQKAVRTVSENYR